RETGRVSGTTRDAYVNWILGDLSRLNLRSQVFKQVVAGVVRNYGSRFSLNSIAKFTDIGSHKTVSKYLDVLQELLLINQIRAVDLSKMLPSYRKNRKAYFTDPFLARVFHAWVTGREWPEEKVPVLVEGVIAEALARLDRRNLGVDHFLWYFHSGREVDFVVRLGEVVGVEVKWRERVGPGDFAAPRQFRNKVILSKNDLSLEESVRVIPVPLFLASI
ncbi:MAG: DUF4143 domain-containing protein, partial [Promethearchaeota archaeon]